MQKPLRIGTRDSPLALWQARAFAQKLKEYGLPHRLVKVKAQGDKDLSTPLHQFGSTGIFTKILDEALYRDEIDLAVHSLKDYPTQAPPGISMVAVLERGAHQDILVYRKEDDFLAKANSEATVATGSIRRVAQWKARYPQHRMVGLRGNVQTRLQRLAESDWQGAIFALAGLQRVNLLPARHRVLHWMLPAPAQGAVGIACKSDDHFVRGILEKLNHRPSWQCVQAERQFLRSVEGGCSAPVGALARIENDKLFLQTGVFSLEGDKQVLVEKRIPLSGADEVGQLAGEEALASGAREIMRELRNDTNN